MQSEHTIFAQGLDKGVISLPAGKNNIRLGVFED
jgi:hypothetical protein